MTDPETFPFLCPACEQLMIAEFATVAEFVDCPGCGRELQIPEPSPDPLVPSLGQLPKEMDGATLVEGIDAVDGGGDESAPTFEFDCPQCGAQLMAYRTDAGQTTQCPSCEHKMRIPEPPARQRMSRHLDDVDSDWLDAQSDAAWELSVGDAERPGEDTHPFGSKAGEAQEAAASNAPADEDAEAQELIAALRQDYEAVAREKRRTRTSKSPAQQPAEIKGAAPAEPQTEAESSKMAASAEVPADAVDSQTLEALGRDMVRSINRWLVKFARSAAQHPQAPAVVVYKAKESEAPVIFALYARAEGVALAFTVAHVLMSVPESKQLKLIKPSAVKVQATFRKATPPDGDLAETAGKPGLARVRLAQKRKDEKSDVCAEVRFEFEADSPEERTALRLRSLLQNWISQHPVLKATRQ